MRTGRKKKVATPPSPKLGIPPMSAALGPASPISSAMIIAAHMINMQEVNAEATPATNNVTMPPPNITTTTRGRAKRGRGFANPSDNGGESSSTNNNQVELVEDEGKPKRKKTAKSKSKSTKGKDNKEAHTASLKEEDEVLEKQETNYDEVDQNLVIARYLAAKDEQSVTENGGEATAINIIQTVDSAVGTSIPVLSTISEATSIVQNNNPIAAAEMRIKELEMERNWAWGALQGTNMVANNMMSSASLDIVTRLIGLLCGQYLSDPSPFHASTPPLLRLLLADLAVAVDCRPLDTSVPISNLTLDVIFARALHVLMGPWDGLRPLKWLVIPSDRVPAFAPPDVLWTLVHTGDPVLYNTLVKAIGTAMNACPDTQRGMALLLTLGRLQGGKMMMGVNAKLWATWQVAKLEENHWRLDDTLDGGLKRVAEAEIEGAFRFLNEKRGVQA
ncbi:hypothetical protein CI109_101755 [Kwoniella shandongensis]|uniref:Uncharacterized protein n=1 Tax=Kwoniella shandongensis TaxID=1734106 RepID=A0A5M6C958_9TREE|nr:uncharacterized protein CI109_001123 [Kwoniella shandongensis]KAA5530322.1 hypothetical protein CI109_001123 [Kwoniella shandongensis]